ncbi:unnamed protein product [Effrenium voratum]|nr:unnamed protein product [Effrenium voratum]
MCSGRRQGPRPRQRSVKGPGRAHHCPSTLRGADLCAFPREPWKSWLHGGGELSCFPEFGVFDWKEVDEYCKHRRVHDGKWWHHGPHSEETERSFRRRAVQLKKWLGRLQDHRSAPKVLMVCHGGIMQAAFDYQPHPPNCAFRVYDVDRSGRARHVAAEAWVASESLADPAFQVLSVVRLNEKVDGVTMFRVEIAVGQEEFYSDISENVLRDNLHDPVKEALPSELYDQFSLGGLFPSWWSWLNRARTDLSIYIQDYLEQLSVAMADVAFPKPCAKLVDELLLQGRLQIQEDGYLRSTRTLAESPDSLTAPMSRG